jgi:chromosome segregation ATPase
MNPTDLARERWKPFRLAQERIEKAHLAYREAQARLTELRSQLDPAAAADSLALGKAILAGKAEPKSEADAIREEIQLQERRVDALQRAHTDAQEQLVAVIKENKRPWYRETLTETSKARSRYEAAVDELVASREALSSTVGLAQWVESGGASHAEPVYDRLSGGQGTLGFSEVVTALRDDLDQIASHDVLEHERPARVALERVQRAGSWGR